MFCSVLDLTKQLISRPSISPNDAGCQEIIINRLKNIGFNVKKLNFNQTSNFWAWHGQGNTLAFVGHTDVVPVGNMKNWKSHPFNPKISKGILYGRGSSDMKGALAAMIIASELFIYKNPNHSGRLAFIITSDEESLAKDGTIKIVEYLMNKKEKLNYCLIGEPSSELVIGDVIKHGRRGSITANLLVQGVSGHVAYINKIKNPIHLTIPILYQLINTIWDQGNSFFPPTTMQITSIHSSYSKENLTPDSLKVQFNFRFNDELTDLDIRNKIQEIIKNFNLNSTIDWYLSGNPFISMKSKLADIAIDVIKFYQGITPRLETSGGTSDGRFLNKISNQILELGLINKTIHKTNECVKISDLKILSSIYQNIIEKLIL